MRTEMKTLSMKLTAKSFVVGTATAIALATAFISFTPDDAVSQGQGLRAGQGGQGSQGGGGIRSDGRGGTSIEGRIFRGKGERVIIILEDDDSDRPPWAQGNRDENPHAQGGGQPTGAGDKKGDLFGDLVVVVRDPVTGLPEYVTVTREDDDGNPVSVDELQICTDANCTESVLTVFGEIPEDVTPVEVDFGRAAIARAPDKVISQALNDAVTKLQTADDGSITTDDAGRITFTIEGISFTIDSPRENLALYIELMDALANDNTESDLVEALGDLATLNTAAALFAGVADKTGDISLDYVYYQNRIVDLDYVESGDDSYYDFSTFTYDRNFATDYTYVVTLDGGQTFDNATLDINAYLDEINGALPDANDKADLFAAAADDAVEVIELIHTQVHTEILPGTVTP